MKKFIYLLLFVAVVGIQFIPVEISNPPVTENVYWDSQQTFELAKRACYDCHSNETQWPWYSRIAPVSWFIANDVNEAREHLNFSTGNLKNAKEAAEEVMEEKMPLKSYLFLHPKAKLSQEEKQAFIKGLKNTFGTDD
jgi:hypothetical protein